MGDKVITDEVQLEYVREAEVKATRLIDAHITLAVYPTSEKEAAKILTESAAGKVVGRDGTKYIGIVIDPGQMGETATSPHLRIPALHVNEIKTLLRSIIQTRNSAAATAETAELGLHDIFFLFDNMHPHNMQKLLQCFVDGNNVAVEKHQHRVHLTYDEDSLRARKAVVRQSVLFEQIEDMRLITRLEYGNTGLPMVRRRNYKGTNMGNKMGDIVLPNYALLWQMSATQKLEVHGPKCVQVGGKVEGQEDVGRGHKPRTPNSVEPVIWGLNLPSQHLWHMFPNLAASAATAGATQIGDFDGTPIEFWTSVFMRNIEIVAFPSRSSGMPAPQPSRRSSSTPTSWLP